MGDEPVPPVSEADLIARFRESAGVSDRPAALAEEMDTAALQRHPKAIGTYGFGAATRCTASSRPDPGDGGAPTSTATPTALRAGCSTRSCPT